MSLSPGPTWQRPSWHEFEGIGGRVSGRTWRNRSEVRVADRKCPAHDERFWPDRQTEAAALWKLGRGKKPKKLLSETPEAGVSLTTHPGCLNSLRKQIPH